MSATNSTKEWMILNQRKEWLSAVEEPPPKVFEGRGIPKDAAPNCVQVLFNRSLDLIANRVGGLGVDAKKLAISDHA